MLVFYGSPHENGVTARLCRAFLDTLKAEHPRVEISIFDAYKEMLPPCVDCGGCAGSLCCTQDGFEKLHSALLNAQAIVIASPVYHLSFPAPLKAVFDRMQPYFMAQKRGEDVFTGRDIPAAVLLSAGAPSERGETVKKQLRWILPTVGAHLSGIVTAANTDKLNDFTQIETQARELAGKIAAELAK